LSPEIKYHSINGRMRLAAGFGAGLYNNEVWGAITGPIMVFGRMVKCELGKQRIQS